MDAHLQKCTDGRMTELVHVQLVELGVLSTSSPSSRCDLLVHRGLQEFVFSIVEMVEGGASASLTTWCCCGSSDPQRAKSTYYTPAVLAKQFAVEFLPTADNTYFYRSYNEILSASIPFHNDNDLGSSNF